MALFKGHVENKQDIAEDSPIEKLNQRPSLLESTKHYFNDKFLQWKAFGANQMEESEIVQAYRKMTDTPPLPDNIISFEEKRITAAQASQEQKKTTAAAEKIVQPTMRSQRNVKFFAIPETGEQKQKRRAEEAEEKEYEDFTAEFETMILQPSLSIYDTPAAIANFLGINLSILLTDAYGEKMRSEFYILSTLHPDDAVIAVPDIFRVPRAIESEQPQSFWSKMKAKIPFLNRSKEEEIDETKVVQLRDIARKRYDKEQQKALVHLKKTDDNVRNKWRIVESIVRKLGRDERNAVLVRILQKLVDKHIGKLNRKKIIS